MTGLIKKPPQNQKFQDFLKKPEIKTREFCCIENWHDRTGHNPKCFKLKLIVNET